ncbi:hypothetical protein ATE78_09205 [Sphingopyxis sp. H012]|nr:hypothetical protein ATE78_09205 [Sphingopyxis sp. H012]KTE06759.1 hypothetical protein ATE76_18395 [Sphingopyxis sp. H093]KTE30550.1 hypothetical protein ATE75_02310 [Sphingopyxis sp. H080]
MCWIATLVLRHMNAQMIRDARHRMQTCIGFMISPRSDMPVGYKCKARIRKEPRESRSDAEPLIAEISFDEQGNERTAINTRGHCSFASI